MHRGGVVADGRTSIDRKRVQCRTLSNIVRFGSSRYFLQLGAMHHSSLTMLFQVLRALAVALTFTATAAAPAWAVARFEDNMAQRALACTGCHGEQGRAGPDGYYPRLAGKPVGYLYNQLLNLRDGRRHYGLMQGLLEPLPDTFLLQLAQHFSGLDLPYPASVPSTDAPAIAARGRTLVTDGDAARDIPACQQCHGKALTGAAPNVPGLLGLPRDYLNAQLGGWRTGQRRAHTPDCMGQIASRLSSSDVAAVTHWLAAQPVPANAKPLAEMPKLPPGAKEIRCGSAPLPAPPAASSALTALQTQGAYLARAGNCQACHTATGGADFSGNRPIETPFGIIHSSNLTPDKATGLGGWTSEEFWQAMHHGRSRDGRLLNPAFPYTSFTQITRADADALFAFLQSLAPVAQATRAHSMRWPFGTQAALWAWRTLYFSPQRYEPQRARSEQWNRGAYLVNGLGHCGECHSPRNALGAVAVATHLRGGVMAAQNWYAPSLRDPQSAGVMAGSGNYGIEAAVQLLRKGTTQHATANGPMTQVVQGSTQYLREADLRAMAVYLQSHNDQAAPASIGPQAAAPQERGARLYGEHCADCHGERGLGVANAYVPLAASRALQLPDSRNLIRTVLFGGFAAATQTNPKPFGMPPFMLKLSDQETADVLSFIRSAWGNRAAPVTGQDVTRERNRIGN